MQIEKIIGTAALGLILGISAPAYGQHNQDDKGDHQKQDHAKPEQKHDQKQGHAQQQNEQHGQSDQREQPRNAQQQRHDQPQHAQQQSNSQRRPSAAQQRTHQAAWQSRGSQHWESDHRTWQQRGGYHGYRVPDYRYRGYFGPDHGFRIHGLPFLVVGGYPRFQYQGYWLSPVDPWPTYWGSNWYDTDDVYVTYVDNGYYMYNRRYPTVGIAISISL